MTIGEFARLSHLSIKALRLYDSMGLLKPASVDEESGYRYYLPSQVEPARLISLLRRLEMRRSLMNRPATSRNPCSTEQQGPVSPDDRQVIPPSLFC